jgi:hypothetical protein
MIINNITKLYKAFRRDGYTASHAVHAARTLSAFRKLEVEGLVRIRVEADEEPYDWGDIEPSESDIETLNNLGVWGTIGEVYEGCKHCGNGKWTHVASCWGHAGYQDPSDPFENWYIIDHMASCVDYCETHNITA